MTHSTHDRGRTLCWVLSLTIHCAAVALLAFTAAPAARPPRMVSVRSGSVSLVLRSSFNSGQADDSQTAPVIRAAYQSESEAQPPSTLESAAAPRRTEDVPSAAPQRSGAQRASIQLFGVATKGNRFVYVFDRSASMEGNALAVAKHELIASLQTLDQRQQFQIIFYNQEPLMMPVFRGRSSPMATADDQSKRQAINFIGAISADGSTHPLRALAAALALQPDVIFFLTDSDSPSLTLAELLHVQRLNQGTVINSIEFGAGPPPLRYNYLIQLAADHGGQHAYVDVMRVAQ